MTDAEQKRWKTALKKPRMDLVPARPHVEVAKAITFGTIKYAERDWETNPSSWGKHVGAAERHIAEFKKGVNFDYESGLHHLTHAATRIMMALDLIMRGVGEDDRGT